MLLTSEVVTNAVLHGGPYGDGDDIVVMFDSTGRTARVEVRDHNLDLPTVEGTSTTGLAGRGMHVVDSLASAWGVSADVLGKWVWFEVHA